MQTQSDLIIENGGLHRGLSPVAIQGFVLHRRRAALDVHLTKLPEFAAAALMLGRCCWTCSHGAHHDQRSRVLCSTAAGLHEPRETVYLRAAALPELAPLLALLITSSLPRYAVGAASGRLLPRQRDRRPAAGAADPAALTAGVAVLLRQHHPAHLQANPFPSASLRTVFTGCQNTSGAKHRKSIWSVVWFFGCRVQQLLCSCEARATMRLDLDARGFGMVAMRHVPLRPPYHVGLHPDPNLSLCTLSGEEHSRLTVAAALEPPPRPPSAKCRHGNHSLRHSGNCASLCASFVKADMFPVS